MSRLAPFGCNADTKFAMGIGWRANCGIKPSPTVCILFEGSPWDVLVVIGKMIVLPALGILSTLLLSTFYTTVPEEIAGSLYLVLMIVFLTPTANNIMVMVELSGSKMKEGMARIIAYQYIVAPFVLSGTVTCAVLVATSVLL